MDKEASRLNHIKQFKTKMPSFTAKDCESNYEILLRSLREMAPQRSIVVLLTDVTRPSTQEQILEVFKHVSRKHLAVCSGILEKKLMIDSFANRSSSNIDLWSDATYSYWLHEEFEKFRAQMKQIGSSAIVSTEQNWQSTNDAICNLLRQSLLS